MKWIKNKLFTWIAAWDSFWFKPVDAISLAAFRFCFCSILLIMYVIRFFDIRIFFYETGLLSSSSAKTLHKLYTDNVIHLIFSSDLLLYLFYLLFIIILLLMTLGIANRLLAVGAFVLHLVFLQRNPSIIFGADMVATFWLFYLMFASSNKQIKWLSYFLNKKQSLVSERAEKGDWLSTIAFRFLQIQLCVIYMFSGLEKLKGSSWWEGTAIWEALSFYDFALIDFSFLLSIPLLSGFLVIFTILFEIYFPVLVWIPKIRKTILLAGICFHVGIGLCLNIHFFSLVMLSSYVLFIPPGFLRRILSRF